MRNVFVLTRLKIVNANDLFFLFQKAVTKDETQENQLPPLQLL